MKSRRQSRRQSRPLHRLLDRDALGCWCALDTRLDRRDRDKPHTRLLQTNRARRDLLLLLRLDRARPTYRCCPLHEFA